MIISGHQPSYLPRLGYFHKILNSNEKSLTKPLLDNLHELYKSKSGTLLDKYIDKSIDNHHQLWYNIKIF